MMNMMMHRTIPSAVAWRLSFNPFITCGNDDEYDDAKDHANDAADADDIIPLLIRDSDVCLACKTKKDN